MKTLSLKTTKIANMFQQLHQNFGGQLHRESTEYELDLDNGLGQGLIKGFAFKGGVSFVEFDMTFSENFRVSWNTQHSSPFYFAYCSQGQIEHRFESEEERRTLQNFQTGILFCKPSEANILYFEKGRRLKASLIVINATGAQTDHGTNHLYHNLRKSFFSDRNSESFAYVGSYNLQIAEKIQQLRFISHQGIAKNLLVEGTVHMILGLEIQQQRDDLHNNRNTNGSLTGEEMERVKELSEFITHYAETDLPIKKLSRKSGLSPSKLQEGFKLMHGRTVTDHIREVRIQKSEQLIKNTDMNISEIVYSIGFTSRSYFSKIFKNKYNCSPKIYRKGNRMAAS
ncbi:AraC family transcriptional regulator [Pricia sp. S334]|uniref:AraC family transcriptional regulator n=1 Tax=Pricia mediterranea TaxID=3076079 RepID=A0ABU3L1G3_9FLAO|nr:AraC family transcriptional regulator [Pricia sp. S334]MDT7827570.1 AraC family transcriptional regulator [Pricia sp. S334]